MSGLERRYRRLLGLYPRDHREQHGEEMLGVLMAAGGDRARPGWRDTADLLQGAFRLHLRRLVPPGVEDVLAIVSLLGPVAVLGGAAVSLHEVAWWVKTGALGTLPVWRQIPDAPVWFVWLAVAVLAVLGRRRAAAVGAWVGTAGLVVLTELPSVSWRWDTSEAGWVLLGAVTAVALTFSPGPARGRERAGRAPVVVMAATVGVFVALGVLGYGEPAVEWARLGLFVSGAVVACGLATRTGRLAGPMLLPPVMTGVTAQVLGSLGWFRLNDAVGALIFFGVPLAVVVAVGTAAIGTAAIGTGALRGRRGSGDAVT